MIVNESKSQNKEFELHFQVMRSHVMPFFFLVENAVYLIVQFKKETLVKSIRIPLRQPRH